VFFFVEAASAPITIRTRGTPTSPREFIDVGPGAKFGPVTIDQKWSYLDITSSAIQVVKIVISDDAEFDVAGTVTVAGNVLITEQPTTTIVTPAANVIANASALSIAANASRKRITIANLSTGGGSVFIQSPGAGAGRGVEVQSGMNHIVRGAYAFAVRNDSGSSQTIMQTEES
jgi:hypothetical protein